MTQTATAAGGANSGPGYATHPDYCIQLVPCLERLRATFGGEAIADSTRALVMRETKHVPVYYFPREDVRFDLLEATDHHSTCPFKGEAAYWSIVVGDRRSENAVWGYPAPYDEVPDLADYVAFYWDRVEHWFEEDEEVFVHARDPFTRVDILSSSRAVRVVVGGETVAETTQARFLFETGLPVRHYIPRDDVRMDLLEPSETETACPYKGTACYWSIRAGGQVFPDLVWSYPDPVPESERIKDQLCFFNERVEALFVDGALLPRPKTKWSVD
jgi:uncharacterized protein (DUF427 family)